MDPDQLSGAPPRRRTALWVVVLAVVAFAVPLSLVVVLTGGGQEVDYGSCRTETDPRGCVVNTAVAHAEKVGVDDALHVLKLTIKADRELLAGCHQLTHDLGAAFHRAFGPAAVVPDARWCSYGYIHGVMGAIGKEDPANLVVRSETLCRTVDGELTKSCLHGVGHAAMKMTGSLPVSMTYCEQMTDADGRNSCAQAVVMEIAMSAPDGRLPVELDATTCASLGDESVIGGCAVSMAAESVVRGIGMVQSCAPYGVVPAVDCRYGFGAALANTYLSGFRSPQAQQQREACATDVDCAQGFGMAATLWLGSPQEAGRTCDELLGVQAGRACRAGIIRADRFEQDLW